jgi:hypothetical protein
MRQLEFKSRGTASHRMQGETNITGLLLLALLLGLLQVLGVDAALGAVVAAADLVDGLEGEHRQDLLQGAGREQRAGAQCFWGSLAKQIKANRAACAVATKCRPRLSWRSPKYRQGQQHKMAGN